MFLIQIFYIGHVDIDHPFQESNHLHRLISGAVIDNGKPKTLLYRFRKRAYNLRGIVGRGDEVDVVTTHLLEPYHVTRHVRRSNSLTTSKMADVVILAEKTPKVAVGEEDGP
jgi:hypothetical protein